MTLGFLSNTKADPPPGFREIKWQKPGEPAWLSQVLRGVAGCGWVGGDRA
jgi:hypothetical protein